jgi:hypothetical protein
MLRRFLSRSGSPGLLVVAAATLTLSAQPTKPAVEPSQMYSATFVTLHAGMAQDYEAFVKNDLIPAQKQGGLQTRMTYSNGAFGEGPMFATFQPVASLAQYDQPSFVAKALGEQGAAQLAQKSSKMIASRKVLLLRTRPDLGIAGDPRAAPAPLVLVTEVQVAAGRRGDFETLLKKEIVPVLQQAKVRSYGVLEVVYGDQAGLYYTTLPYDTYEAIGKGHPLQTVLGEEGVKRVEAKFSGVVTVLARHIARYRADLSFTQTKTTSQ